MNTITNITILSNTELEFVTNNRAYLLEVTQDELDATYGIVDTYSECPFTGLGLGIILMGQVFACLHFPNRKKYP